MDQITLIITYNDLSTGNVEKFKIITEKDKLINKSEYFNAMFQNFKESHDRNIEVTLPDNIRCTKEHLEILFDIGVDKNYKKYKPTYKSDIKITYDSNLSNKEIKHTLKTNYGLGVPISEYYIMVSLAGYFNFNNILEFIKSHLNKYSKLLNDICHNTIQVKPNLTKKSCNCYQDDCEACNIDPGDSEEECEEEEVPICISCRKSSCICNKNNAITEDTSSYISENITMNIPFNRYGTTRTYINNKINKYWRKYMTSEFLDNINYVYFVFKTFELEIVFDQVVNTISDMMRKLDIKEHTFSNKLANLIPFDELYNLKKTLNGKIKIHFEDIRLYDSYNIMNYEESDEFKLFKINGFNHIKNNITGTHAIKPKEEFEKLWKLETGNIFDGFNWDNIVLSGGFLYGLVSTSQTGIINSTDIDLFIYDAPPDDGLDDEFDDDIDDTDKDNIDKNTYNDIIKKSLNHFSKFNPFYVKRGGVVTIIIPGFKYDIQLIPSTKSTPYDIINDFDFNYIKMFYDGSDIYIDFDAFIGLKYNLAIYNDKNELKSDRLYKAIVKGFDIVYDDKIKHNCIDNKIIDFKALQREINKTHNFNKSRTIRKLIPHLNNSEIINLIKYYYKTNIVTDNLDDLDKKDIDKESPIDEDYEKFKVIQKIDPKNIVDIKEGYKFHDYQFYNLISKDGHQFDHITLKLDWYPFKFYEDSEMSDHYAIELKLNKSDSGKIISLDRKFEDLLTDKKLITYASEFGDDQIPIIIRIPQSQKNIYDHITKYKTWFTTSCLIKPVIGVKFMAKQYCKKGSRKKYVNSHQLHYRLKSFDFKNVIATI